MTRTAANALLLLLLLNCADTAFAHSRSESYSHWRQSGNRVTAVVTMPAREVTRLSEFQDPGLATSSVLAAHLEKQTSVLHEAAACEQTRVQPLAAASGFARAELQFDCGDSAPVEFRYRGLFDVAPSHVHYAKYFRDGVMRAEFLMTDTSDSWVVPADSDAPASHGFLAFLDLGMKHIASGLDHIAFLLGLLLIAGTFRRSVIAVTGFTLGHSVSLAAAVLGYVHAEAKLVEALIGFTVALVAVEYFVLRDRRVDLLALSVTCVAWVAGTIALLLGQISPTAVLAYLGVGVFGFCYLLLAEVVRDDNAGKLLFVATTCFGLIHGFGFAGFLLETGITGASLIKPLLGFNLGVELGQLAIVAVALLVARFARPLIRDPAPQILAAGLCGLGVFWFIGRSLGV